MKESFRDIDIAFEKKGKKIPEVESTKRLLEISKEQWEIDQKITGIENQIWRLRNEKLSLCDAKMHLEKKKTAIYVSLGMVCVKPLKAADMES